MPLIDVLASGKKERIMRETWGHLAPVPRTAYLGFILFSVSPNGDHNLLDFDFEGLEGNPWTYEHVTDWWFQETRADQFCSGLEVLFWRWEGTYMLQKNNNPRFKGKHVRMELRAAARAARGEQT